MKKYRLTKIGRVGENNSDFGDKQEYFEGYMKVKPYIMQRFYLWDENGNCVINTSPITKIEEGILTTLYSVYKIEEL